MSTSSRMQRLMEGPEQGTSAATGGARSVPLAVLPLGRQRNLAGERSCSHDVAPFLSQSGSQPLSGNRQKVRVCARGQTSLSRPADHAARCSC